jgi:hypothetical protein
MVLTEDILLNNGFYTNHPEKVLASYKKSGSNPEYFIDVQSKYKSLSNELYYDIDCWKCDDEGHIIERTLRSNVKTVEELNDILKYTNINFELNL